MGLARLYLHMGHSINHFVEAKTYLEMLRDHDNRPGALYGLGTIYHEGLGVKVSLTMAEAYYQEAADQGACDGASQPFPNCMSEIEG